MSESSDALTISRDNSRKLDSILQLLTGAQGQPGLVDEHRRVMRDLYGNGKWGISQKIGIVWRIYIWLLCTMSAAIGFLARSVINGNLKIHP